MWLGVEGGVDPGARAPLLLLLHRITFYNKWLTKGTRGCGAPDV